MVVSVATPSEFEDIVSQIAASMDRLQLHQEAAKQAQQEPPSRLAQEGLLKTQLDLIHTSSLLHKHIDIVESKNPSDASVIKPIHAARVLLHASDETISSFCLTMQQKTYELFDRLYLPEEVKPEEFVQNGSFFLETCSLFPEHRVYAHLCLEQAACLLEQAGKDQEAYALRFSLAQRLQELLKLPDSINPSTISPEGILCSGFGAGGLKRGSFIFKQRMFSGEGNKFSLTFHVNPYLGDKIRERAKRLQTDSSLLPVDMQERVAVALIDNGYAGPSDVPQEFSSNLLRHGIVMEQALCVTLKGIGRLTIGCSPHMACLFNRVEVETFAEGSFKESLQHLHLLLTLLGCGPVLEATPHQEEQRRKIALLSHLFAPRETCQLQLSPAFYEGSPQRLQEDLLKLASDQGGLLMHYFENPGFMEEIPLSPTYSQWRVIDLSGQLQRLGAVGLMCGFSGAIPQLASIFQHGLLSSQFRFEQGLLLPGTSSDTDHQKGGAGHVFTRMLTKKMLDTKVRVRVPGERPREEPGCKIELFPSSGTFQILIDLAALDRGGYAYPTDKWGSKEPEHYATRLSFLELIPQLSLQTSAGNEWMIPERIPPELIKGVLVPSAFAKRTLITYLIEQGFVIEIKEKLYFKGFLKRPIEELIITGTAFTPEMWS